jgi:hypothetical protein
VPFGHSILLSYSLLFIVWVSDTQSTNENTNYNKKSTTLFQYIHHFTSQNLSRQSFL